MAMLNNQEGNCIRMVYISPKVGIKPLHLLWHIRFWHVFHPNCIPKSANDKEIKQIPIFAPYQSMNMLITLNSPTHWKSDIQLGVAHV